MNDIPQHFRTIKSYVLRAGRLTPAQQRALEQLAPRYSIPYAEVPLDYAGAFGRDAPTVLEIGFGMGDTTAEIAACYPEQNFLAIEVHPPGVGSLLHKIEERGLTNLRTLQHDAVEVLEHMIPADSLAGIHVFFPDPWHKKRHHKRRLLQAAFVHQLALRLKPGGYLHCATDWAEYAEAITDVLAHEPLLIRSEQTFIERPETKFERRGLKLGHDVFDLIAVRT